MHELDQLLLRKASLSQEARRRILTLPGEPLFLSDWDRVLMIHFEVDSRQLQAVVPFELDLRDGRAFVSVVAFTMKRMRPRFGGRLSAQLIKPISTHEFLNVRTYVRNAGEAGIFFLTEWLSNRLSVRLGPPLFGLPYRFGRINYDHDWEMNRFSGAVSDGESGAAFEYYGTPQPGPTLAECHSGSLDEWLMERYTAFTSARRKARFFRVWHPPWQQIPIRIRIKKQTLLDLNWPFFKTSQLAGANFSPGISDVWMGWLHKARPNYVR